MNSLQSGIGPEENPTYETQGINFQNNPQAKSKNRGKPLYILTAKKKTDLRSLWSFFWNYTNIMRTGFSWRSQLIIQTLLQALAGEAS